MKRKITMREHLGRSQQSQEFLIQMILKGYWDSLKELMILERPNKLGKEKQIK